MSMLKGKAYAPLQQGMYEVLLNAYKEETVGQGRGKQPKHYVRLEWKFDNGRILVDNRFEEGVNNFSMAMSHLADQFQMEEADIPELLNLAKSTKVTIWVEHVTGEDGQHYRNIWLKEPYSFQESSNTTTTNNQEDEVL